MNVTTDKSIHDPSSDSSDKRNASGDARTCESHDVPVYETVLGIQKNELKDERCLSRLRRSGLGDLQDQEGTGSKVKGENDGRSGRRLERQLMYCFPTSVHNSCVHSTLVLVGVADSAQSEVFILLRKWKIFLKLY